MNKFSKALASIVAVSSLTMTADANAVAGILAVGPKVGTLGVGIEGRVPITDNLYARAGALAFNYSGDYKDGGTTFKGKLQLRNVPIMVDYHPIGGMGFRVSLGAAYTDNSLTVNATPTSSVTYNGNTYTPAQVGSVTGKLTTKNNIAGIASIGYDSSVMTNSIMTFDAEVGVMVQSGTKIKTSSSGLLAQSPQFQRDLQKTVEKTVSDVDKRIKLYPILSIGVKFNL